MTTDWIHVWQQSRISCGLSMCSQSNELLHSSKTNRNALHYRNANSLAQESETRAFCPSGRGTIHKKAGNMGTSSKSRLTLTEHWHGITTFTTSWRHKSMALDEFGSQMFNMSLFCFIHSSSRTYWDVCRQFAHLYMCLGHVLAAHELVPGQHARLTAFLNAYCPFAWNTSGFYSLVS